MKELVLIREGDILREIYTNKISYKEDVYLVNKYNISTYYVSNTFEIGNQKDINIPRINIFVDMNKREIIFQKPIYHNFKLNNSGKINFEFGDNLIVGFTVKIEFITKNIIQIVNYFSNTKVNLLEITKLHSYYDEYPFYTASPRYIKEDFKEEIKLELPPEKFKKNTLGELLKKLIPLFVAIAIAILMLKVRPRGIRGLLMLTSMLVSASISLITLYEDRKEAKRYNKHRNEVYTEYLESKTEEANLAKEHELEIYNYNDLSQKSIIREIETNSFRLYEKEIQDEDFLNLRIGVENRKANYKIKNPNDKLKLEKEQFELEVEQIYEDYKVVENVPKTINLRKNNLGLIGNIDVIEKQLHNLLMQVIFSQSYHDTKLIFVLDEEDYPRYEYYKWIKHFINEHNGLYNFIMNESTKEQILNSYLQILRLRDEEDNKEVINKPHLVFVIKNYNIIKNHPIMEFLLKDSIRLGFSLIVIEKEEKNLPKVISAIVDYKNSQDAWVLLENNKAIADGLIKLEAFEQNTYRLEKLVRKIGQLEHIQGVKSVIPDKLTFLEMFEVNTTKELNIINRWRKNKSYKSLSTVIGKKTQRDYVYLNLHEKAHGPHGLVAGTTGSGKSEVIQTFILSLAVNFSPEEVGFLLIDYKGGGMANLFKDMPHHLGSITNLDGYQAMRSLASIKSELKRRQRVFADCGVNNINDYHKLYEKNSVTEALPHLFIISDEFAELKAEQPDFMKELVSVARIGRTLGIHLILATQKPTGVVDDQIWSNSKFKLCLKVAEESDSKELLKTPDAAYIKEAGRGYLKVGTNDLYELFQSGYSGAKYSNEENNNINNNIFEVNKYGGKENIVDEDISYEDAKSQEEEITELKAVLKEIDEIYLGQQYKRVKIKEPWLPPLKNMEILKEKEYDLKELRSDLSVDYGIVDLPNEQSQIPLNHDFIKSGHIAVIGSAAMGKSTLILTMLLGLAQQNSPELLKYYLFDFGNSSLLPIKDLYHTAEYLKVEELDKIKKVLKSINNEIALRKNLFEKAMVNNFASYNNISKEKKEAIVIVLDNIDALKEIDKELMDVFTTLTREAASLGIYLIISGTKPNSLKSGMLSAISSKVVLYTNEKSDITTLIGKSSYSAQEIPGRCQVKMIDVEVAQIYFPVESENEQEYIDKMQILINNINSKTKGIANSGLLEMPEKYTYDIVPTTIQKVYLGKEFEEIEDYYMGVDQLLLIQGQRKSGKTNILKSIIEQLKGDYKITIFDDMLKNLYGYSVDTQVKYVDGIQDAIFGSDIFILNKLDYLNGLDKKTQKDVYEKLYTEYMKGKHFILEAGDNTKGSYELIKLFKRPVGVIWIDDIGLQQYAKIRDKELKKDEREGYDYYYISGRNITKIRPFLVNTEIADIKYEIEEEKVLMVGGSKIDNENILVGGKNSSKVLEALKQGYDDFGQTYIEFEVKQEDKLKDLKDTVIIIPSQKQIEELPRDQRIIIYDNLLELSSNNKIVLSVDSEKIKGTHEFLKPFKRPDRAIISDNLGEQKFKSVPRESKSIEVIGDEAYYVCSKEVKKINL